MHGFLANDMSAIVSVDVAGEGLYTTDGRLRVNTVDTGPGLFADDGAVRGTISTSDGVPAPGTGRYTPSGGLRLVEGGATNNYNNPGLFARDGGMKVTIPI